MCNGLLLLVCQPRELCFFPLLASFGFLYRLRGRGALPREWFGPISKDWLKQGASVRDLLSRVPKSFLPQVLELGEVLESLPLLPERRHLRGQGFHRANRMVFEVQEALFDALVRLLPRLVPDELAQLTPQNRRYLARAIPRSADAAFLSTILLTLATIGDRSLLPIAREYVILHPSEHVREAAQEYLHALGTPVTIPRKRAY